MHLAPPVHAPTQSNVAEQAAAAHRRNLLHSTILKVLTPPPSLPPPLPPPPTTSRQHCKIPSKMRATNTAKFPLKCVQVGDSAQNRRTPPRHPVSGVAGAGMGAGAGGGGGGGDRILPGVGSSRQTSNVYFMFARVNIPVVHVEYACPIGTHPFDEYLPEARRGTAAHASHYHAGAGAGTSADRAFPAVCSEKSILRLRVGGIDVKAKHRRFDSRLTLAVRDLEVEDCVASDRCGKVRPLWLV